MQYTDTAVPALAVDVLVQHMIGAVIETIFLSTDNVHDGYKLVHKGLVNDEAIFGRKL